MSKNQNNGLYHIGAIAKKPSKTCLSHFLFFWHFWYTLMTREGSRWLDINFSMSEPTPRSFVKIWAPLPQRRVSVIGCDQQRRKSQVQILLLFNRLHPGFNGGRNGSLWKLGEILQRWAVILCDGISGCDLEHYCHLIFRKQSYHISVMLWNINLKAD